jgi:hypothetical protein
VEKVAMQLENFHPRALGSQRRLEPIRAQQSVYREKIIPPPQLCRRQGVIYERIEVGGEDDVE